MPELKLLLGPGAGVDKSAYLEPQSVVRIAVLGQTIDRLSCRLVDHDGSLGSIAALSQIVLEDADNAAIRYFGGVVASPTSRFLGRRREWMLECQDWTVLLDKAYAQPRVYRSASYASDKLIIQDIFTRAYTDPMTQADLNEFDDNTHVQVGRAIENFTVNRTPLSQVMNTLAANAIFEWYVDYFKNLHFYPVAAELSSIHLSDAPDGSTTFAYSDLSQTVEGIEAANVIEVVGGWVLTDATLEYIAGDATKTVLSTGYIWLALAGETLPQVWRNDGTFAVPVWTQLTVFRQGDANYTGGADQVEWNALQKILSFGSAPPNLANAIRVNGRYQQRVYARRAIQASFDELGRWFWHKIVDPNIFSQGEAWLRAEREALQRRFGVTTYTLKTQKDGFYVGKRVLLTSSQFSLSERPLVIEKNVMRMLGGETAEYELTLREPYSA